MLTGLISSQWHRCLQRAAWHPSGGRNFYPHCSLPVFLRAKESGSQVSKVTSGDVQPLESGQNEVSRPPFTSLLLGAQKHWWLLQRLPAKLRGPPQLFHITYYLYLNSQGEQAGAGRQPLAKKERKAGKESNIWQFLLFSTQLAEFSSGGSAGGAQ